jgi:uncharacterized membrane protein HdeD (DUF308 family)
MIPLVTRHWWVLALRGLLAVLFGVLALAYPPVTFLLLAIFIAAYLVLDGFFAIVAGVRAAESHRPWWPFAVEGIADLIAGTIVYLVPGVLTILVAVWAMTTGLVMLIPGWVLPNRAGKWLFVIIGLISLALGIVIIARPAAGIVFISWSVAIYALLFGLGLIALALRVRDLHRRSAGGIVL